MIEIRSWKCGEVLESDVFRLPNETFNPLIERRGNPKGKWTVVDIISRTGRAIVNQSKCPSPSLYETLSITTALWDKNSSSSVHLVDILHLTISGQTELIPVSRTIKKDVSTSSHSRINSINIQFPRIRGNIWEGDMLNHGSPTIFSNFFHYGTLFMTFWGCKTSILGCSWCRNDGASCRRQMTVIHMKEMWGDRWCFSGVKSAKTKARQIFAFLTESDIILTHSVRVCFSEVSDVLWEKQIHSFTEL